MAYVAALPSATSTTGSPHIRSPRPGSSPGWSDVQPETKVVNAIAARLERAGCICVKMHGSAYSSRGFPDLLVIRPDGLTIYLEVKVPGRTDGPAGNGMSAAQVGWARKLARQRAPWGVADNPDDASRIVADANYPANLG